MSMICSIYAAKEDDLQRYNGNADDLFDFFEESEDTIDLDKAWHAIHFLLTGSAWEGEPPKNFIVGGGTPIEDSDGGYGEARFFTKDEVAAISSALSELPVDRLLARYDGKGLADADIYPSIWARPDEQDENRDYIRENYSELQSYISGLANRGSSMIVSIQ
jgi:hypothetical protein